jgi:hypothetical protein
VTERTDRSTDSDTRAPALSHQLTHPPASAAHPRPPASDNPPAGSPRGAAITATVMEWDCVWNGQVGRLGWVGDSWGGGGHSGLFPLHFILYSNILQN